MLTECPSSTYCGKNVLDAEGSAATCTNSTDDDGDQTVDCDDVDCCSVVSCELETGCNPIWCLDGIAELKSSPPTALQTTTTSAAGPFALYVAGFDIWWNPLTSAPYATSCNALDQFINAWDCSVTVDAQAWKQAGTCGYMRGVVSLHAQDGSGGSIEIKIASGVALSESQVQFESP